MTHSRVPKLMLVTDRRSSHFPLPELAVLAIAGGVDVVQVREKDLGVLQLQELVHAIVAAVGNPSRLSVNGNVSIARNLGVGVHLPEAGPKPAEARRELGPDSLIGRSVHTPESARESEGADYLIAGHVFTTASKPDRPPIGPEGLCRIIEAAPCPVLAIGGITAENMHAVLSAGAYGVAVISAINSSDNPESAARALRIKLDSERNAAMATVTTQVEVTINGKQVTLEEGTTIQQFLHSKGYQDRLVVVELNESILPRDAYPSTTLATGDRVEIVHFVGGG